MGAAHYYYRPCKQFMICIIVVALILCFFPYCSQAENEMTSPEKTIDLSQNSVSAESFSEFYHYALSHFYAKQITKAYNALLYQTRRDNFRGYCAMYVNNLLVYFGINHAYIKGNANVLFSLYDAKSYTDNGYFIETLSAKEYTLSDALLALSASESPIENILVVFSKGATEKGREFGHVFYVNAIIGNQVIFSESSPFVLSDDTVIQDGKPIIMSINQVCNKYEFYKFEGTIHFTSLSMPHSFTEFWYGARCNYSPLQASGSRRALFM